MSEKIEGKKTTHSFPNARHTRTLAHVGCLSISSPLLATLPSSLFILHTIRIICAILAFRHLVVFTSMAIVCRSFRLFVASMVFLWRTNKKEKGAKIIYNDGVELFLSAFRLLPCLSVCVSLFDPKEAQWKSEKPIPGASPFSVSLFPPRRHSLFPFVISPSELFKVQPPTLNPFTEIATPCPCCSHLYFGFRHRLSYLLPFSL